MSRRAKVAMSETVVPALRRNEDWEFEHLDGCVVCHSTRLEAIHHSRPRGIPLRFDRCLDCSFIFQNPRLTRASLQNYFDSGTFIEDSKSNDNALDEQLGYFNYLDMDHSYKRTAAIRLRRLGRFRPAPGRLLEVGSATGSFLDEARKLGFQVRGLDVSSTFADMARRRYGLDVDVGWIEEFPLPAEGYDVVCMLGGISCWRDLMQGLANVRRALTPGGVFFFNYADYHGLLAGVMGRRYPEFNHASLSILHRQGISACLQKAGFTVMADQTEWQIASLARIVTYLKMRRATRLLKALRVRDVEIPVLAIGTRQVIAVKP
jgi:SAM-dependent methyltransferase